MNKHLDENFLPELFRACINKKSIFIVVRGVLKLNFLPEKSGYREVWKAINKYYDREDKCPTIGILNQNLSTDERAIDCVTDIKNVVKIDYDGLIKTLEEFIKQNKFVELYEEVGAIYNDGEKDKAFSKFTNGAQELVGFTLKSALHDAIFSGFNKRFSDRLFKLELKDKVIPTGIDVLDHKMGGGMQRGEATLILADSGVGKSQMLIHLGVSAARRGFNVAHFQAEGTKVQVLDRYDAAWTGTLYKDMKMSNIDTKKYQALLKIVKKIGGEIYVEAREKFGSWTMMDIRNSLIEMLKSYRKIDLVLIDYLELVDPGDGKIYRANEERFRQQATARLMKDIAVEFDVAVATPTQASAIPPDAKQDPDFVLTRWNISEDKGKIRPFDNFMTLNQTTDEKRNKMVRIYIDKLREHNTDGDVILIAQNLARSRFYDRQRTINEIMEDHTKELLKNDFGSA